MSPTDGSGAFDPTRAGAWFRTGIGRIRPDAVNNELRERLRRLNRIAADRGQSLARIAVAWVLRHPAVTSALVAASRVDQIGANVAALDRLEFSDEEPVAVDEALAAAP